MAQEYNAKCSICGKKYHVCNDCMEQKTFKPWRVVTDTIEHYKIYLAIHNYTISKNKEQAKNELESCNLDGFEHFDKDIKNIINEILYMPSKNKSVSKNTKRTVEVQEKNNTNENKDNDVE